MGEDLTPTSAFVTNQVFNSREEIIAWVRSVGRSVGCVVVTKRSKYKPHGGDAFKVVFVCEHSGVYKSDKISGRHTGTKKFDCPFDMISKEYDRSFETSIFSEKCGCKLRTSCGLPCAHEQALYTCQRVPIPLDAIDVFWKKLDFSPCVSAQDDEIQCDNEVEMFRENFNKQSVSGRKSMLKKLKNMITTSKTLFREPSVHKTTRGRPSLKKSNSKKILKTLVDIVVLTRQPLSTLKILVVKNQRGIAPISNNNPPPPNPYLDQIPSLFHPYIVHIENVLGDGNCGFRAISTCLGGHEDAWDYIRKELMVELTEYQHYYSYVIGDGECIRIFEALNFFQKGVFAPVMHWIAMPEMGILTASRFNVILHVLNMAGSVTYLQFRTQLPSSSEHVSIAIVHVDGNHYIKVVLNGEYPMPHSHTIGHGLDFQRQVHGFSLTNGDSICTKNI